MCIKLNRVLLIWAAIILAAWLGTRLYAKHMRAERLQQAKAAAAATAGNESVQKGNSP